MSFHIESIPNRPANQSHPKSLARKRTTQKKDRAMRYWVTISSRVMTSHISKLGINKPRGRAGLAN